jgi:hypothetical protein
MKGSIDVRPPNKDASKINATLVKFLKKNDDDSKVDLSGMAKMLGERREHVLNDEENNK